MTNIFLSVLGISASVGIIVIVLILFTPFLNKRYAAKWKYLIWIFLALRLLVPFGGVNRQFMFLQAKTQTANEVGEKDADAPTGITAPVRRIVFEIPTQMTTPIAVDSKESNIGITMLDIVTVVWMMGSLIFIGMHLITYAHYKRQVMKAGSVIDEVHILNQMFHLKRELRMKRSIQAIEYHEAQSPMIIGFLHPVLVLPEEQYSSQEIFFILKHELVHLKRGDVYFKLLFVTANAIHWFNPFIWMMQKEAVIDMELSCDERVTQGASYDMRKAYTETLLSMLHKQCAKKTILSTQFYGGTKIMKKRFVNILKKSGKKNGIFILICGVVLTISLGTLIGCSAAKEDTEKEIIKIEDTENVEQPEKEEIQIEQVPENSPSVEDNIVENTSTLTFSKEGEQEQKQTTLVIGDGYSIYLPDNEWQQSGPDLWKAALNDQVLIWITHFENKSMDGIVQELEDDGYETLQDYDKWKQEEDVAYHVKLKSHENDIWGVFYCYPSDYEEGWGRELPVIADTFAVTDEADNAENDDVKKTD